MTEPGRPEERAEQAQEALARLDRETTGVFSSALSRAGDHLAARDADPSDAAELWGRRAGRFAGMVAVVVLSLTLGRQLGWW